MKKTVADVVVGEGDGRYSSAPQRVSLKINGEETEKMNGETLRFHPFWILMVVTTNGQSG